MPIKQALSLKKVWFPTQIQILKWRFGNDSLHEI